MFPGILAKSGLSENLIFFRLYRKMAEQRVKVPLKQGVVVGQERRLPSGRQYESFLGVPYAVPPLGKLRFRSPIPLERFDTAELDCSKERDVAHQRDPMTREIVGSENCLFLNVYAPKNPVQKGPLPVMVWIHGGGFFFGNGNSDFHFPKKLLEQEVVVVTLNYRLGALGFLYLPEEGIYGNAGLKDQRLALQWVQDNIGNFNGDPKNVTIFGESAGAASVHLHTYAEHAKKLFHKAIVESGTANMEWVFQQQPDLKTRKLADLIAESNGRSQINDSKKLLDYLQSEEVSPLSILAYTLPVLTPDEKRRQLPLPFKPVIEDSASPDSFLNRPIMELFHDKERLQGLPIIMGYNSGEGMAMAVAAVQKLDVFEKDFVRLVPRDLVLSPNSPEAQAAAADIRSFFLNGQSLTMERADNLVDILTDFHFNIDLQKAAEIHAYLQTKSPLYFYRFDYVGGRNMYKRMFQFEKLRGASHGDELFYLFQMADNEETVAQDDLLMSERICQMWANFAKTGKPAEDWTPVQMPSGRSGPFKLDYMRIDRKCEMRSNPDGERIEFWRSMYKRYRPSEFEAMRARL